MKHASTEQLAALVIVSLFMGFSQSASAAKIDVANAVELEGALLAAKAGDILRLAPGSYGELILNGNQKPALKFSGPVTITALDTEHQPVFNRIILNGVSNLFLSHFLIDYTFKSNAENRMRFVEIKQSDNIALEDSIFDGDKANDTGTDADGYGFAFALSVEESNRITIANNKIYTWMRGAVFSKVHGLTVTDNELSELRSDGFDFAAVTDAIIARNHIHDFKRSPLSKDHPDMIQFWTNGTQWPSVNVAIENNILDIGTGDWTQSIFMRNEEVDTGRAGSEMYYKNFRIEGNVIRNANMNGIRVGEIDGITISKNTILQSVNSLVAGKVSVPLIIIKPSALNVTVTQNIFPRQGQSLKTAPAEWRVSANTSAQRDDPQRPDYYSKVFVDALKPGPVDLGSIAVLPGSDAAKIEAGSPLTAFNGRPSNPTAYITNVRRSVSGDIQLFTVSNVFGSDGDIPIVDRDIKWDFGDGAVGKGNNLEHSYEKFGDYNVSAVVTLMDGREIKARRLIEVRVK
jgi:PKD domain/Right handed beta helix region